jgi:Lon protease-like protein
MALRRLLISLYLSSCCITSHAFVPSPQTRTLSRVARLFLYRNEDPEDLKRRMEMVRTLQTCFYKSAEASPARLDYATGKVYNLPLWRVQWYELPGRTNVLYIQEPMYTNMIEQLLHTSPPWYIGHLHLEGGSENLKSRDPSHKLQSWQDQFLYQTLTPRPEQASTLGTILRISDYRRMADGRLLLLVQGLERFVVTDVVQELPYGIANVQLVPDREEIADSDWQTSHCEDEIASGRALAVQETFGRWHRYEFENTVLPLPLQTDLPTESVACSALSKVLPYACYSSVVNVEKLKREYLPSVGAADQPGRDMQSSFSHSRSNHNHHTLEYKLLRGGILDSYLMMHHIDEIEYRVWMALNSYLSRTRVPVSPVLLGLLPHGISWPEIFVLERIGDAIGEQTVLEHKYVRVSPDYPAQRRQKRLSYAAAAVLRDLDATEDFRRTLLQIPSTKERLVYVLQYLERDGSSFQ